MCCCPKLYNDMNLRKDSCFVKVVSKFMHVKGVSTSALCVHS